MMIYPSDCMELKYARIHNAHPGFWFGLILSEVISDLTTLRVLRQ